LQIGSNFDYITHTLSLQDFDFIRLETDFDYKTQCLILIPNDLGNIKNNLQEIVEFLRDFYMRVKGNTMTLFTSFQVIKEVYIGTSRVLEQQGIQVLAQSVSGGKQKLIETFKTHADNTILLGTDSFWEGIDIPGDDLKYLIIHKIPFMVPSDPIFLARSKLYTNPFEQYSIPKAILKLKQGFGRLIRTKSDTGVLILLDNRITHTSWGKSFLEAFPTEIPIKSLSG